MAEIFNRFYETMEREKIKKIQLSRLQEMVDYCINNVPFYKQKLAAVGIFSSNQIETLSDIVKIPFTTKEDIKNNYPDGLYSRYCPCNCL
mgnify:CR=1 FL=1